MAKRWALIELAVERGHRRPVGEAGQAAAVQRDPVVALDRRADHPWRPGRDVEGCGEVVDRRRRRAARVDGALAVEVVQHRLGRAVEGVEREVDEQHAGLLRRDDVVGRRRRRQLAQPVAVAVVTRRVDELRPGVRGDHPLRARPRHHVELVDGRRDAGGVRELEVVGDVVLAVGAEEGERRRAQRPHDDRGERVGNLDQLRVVDRVAGRGGAHRRAGRGAEREGREHGDVRARGRRRAGRRVVGRVGEVGFRRALSMVVPPSLSSEDAILEPGHDRCRRFTPDLRFWASIATARGRRPPRSPPEVAPSGRGGAHSPGALTHE